LAYLSLSPTDPPPDALLAPPLPPASWRILQRCGGDGRFTRERAGIRTGERTTSVVVQDEACALAAAATKNGAELQSTLFHRTHISPYHGFDPNRAVWGGRGAEIKNTVSNQASHQFTTHAFSSAHLAAHERQRIVGPLSLRPQPTKTSLRNAKLPIRRKPRSEVPSVARTAASKIGRNDWCRTKTTKNKSRNTAAGARARTGFWGLSSARKVEGVHYTAERISDCQLPCKAS